MSEKSQFVGSVRKDGSINIPAQFADHHDIQQGDTLEVEVVSHKRDGKSIK